MTIWLAPEEKSQAIKEFWCGTVTIQLPAPHQKLVDQPLESLEVELQS